MKYISTVFYIFWILGSSILYSSEDRAKYRAEHRARIGKLPDSSDDTDQPDCVALSLAGILSGRVDSKPYNYRVLTLLQQVKERREYKKLIEKFGFPTRFSGLLYLDDDNKENIVLNCRLPKLYSLSKLSDRFEDFSDQECCKVLQMSSSTIIARMARSSTFQKHFDRVIRHLNQLLSLECSEFLSECSPDLFLVITSDPNFRCVISDGCRPKQGPDYPLIKDINE